MSNETLRQHLLQSVDNYYNDRSVDSLTEKLLVEICASHVEGKSFRQIANCLGLDTLTVKLVVKRNSELENRVTNPAHAG